MKNIEKENKGITLVALIIAIIVMLILVSVSVSVVIRSNILNSAKSASQQLQLAEEEESNLGNNIIINGVKYNSIEEYTKTEKEPEEEPEARIIEFICGIKTCQAEEGMTWEEWCNSSYVPTGWYYGEDGNVYTGEIVKGFDVYILTENEGPEEGSEYSVTY